MPVIDYDTLIAQADEIKDPAKKAEAYRKIKEQADFEASGGKNLSGQIAMQKYKEEAGMKSGAADLILGLMSDKTKRVEPEEFRGVEGSKLRQGAIQFEQEEGKNKVWSNSDIDKYYGKEEVVQKGMKPNTPEFESAMLAGLGSMGMDPGKIKEYKQSYGVPEDTNEVKTLKQLYPGQDLATAHEQYKKAGKNADAEAKDDIAVRNSVANLAKKEMVAKHGMSGLKFDMFGEPQFPEGYDQKKYYRDFYETEKKLLKQYGKDPLSDDPAYSEGRSFMEKYAKTDQERKQAIQAMKKAGWDIETVKKMAKELGWE